ncbi:mRNA surveillance protein pelota [Lichtheimia ornata]|uniref:Protein DOM34 homolog n=1 Tax=Lichtheimia ornata TaxID=688661 RepID=A0AAD7V8J5_9FUNG|nr:mRNA surveillance protein pelota [Lichtheimia ornata]KAJ8661019.1 mRNA surveillance protein pelota [Lichtheimia ornata]
MRLINKTVEKDATGHVTLYPEELEDMWHVYNLISKEDQIKATTFRRLQSESSTGSTTSQRTRMVLTITVESVDFDPQVGLLRINGRVTSENPYVKLGSYHTIDLELNRNFTLYKPEWDIIALERVDEACDIAKQADVAAIVCQEGLANVCFLTEHMTVVKQRIETPIPRKRKGSVTNHEKGLEKFYDQIYQAILRLFDFNILKAVIIASPGFVREQVYQYISDQAVKTENKTILENRSKFVLVHSSSGHKHSLNEVMQDPSIQNKLADTKAAREVQALDEFYAMMNADPDRAFYGYSHVAKANEHGAIGTLLVTDELFRSADIATRRKYVDLVESVRSMGGTVRVFSSMHVSGEQLNLLSGVAAILTFPFPGIDDGEEEDEEGEGDNNEQ